MERNWFVAVRVPLETGTVLQKNNGGLGKVLTYRYHNDIIKISKHIKEDWDMKEKVLQNKKNGMTMMFLFIVLYVLAIAACVVGGMMVADGGLPVLLIISIVWLVIGWIPFC